MLFLAARSGFFWPQGCRAFAARAINSKRHKRDAYKYWVPIQTRWKDNDQYSHINNAEVMRSSLHERKRVLELAFINVSAVLFIFRHRGQSFPDINV